MKVLCLVLVGVLASAQAKIDWDNVFHMEMVHPKSPGFLPPHLRPRPSGRIVGGQLAKAGQFPYQAALFIDMGMGTAICGGSLLTPNYVLTAAHCVDGAVGAKVVLGALDIYDDFEEGRVEVRSKSLKKHPSYSSWTITNDIALIELAEPVKLTKKIQLTRLPSSKLVGTTFAGENSTISGWGKTADNGQVSPKLRYVSNPILTNSDCSTNMAGLNIPSTQICQAGSGAKGACNGDSGGPLVVEDESGKRIQVGITSYGLVYGCEKGYAGAYTRVTSYLDWIKENSDL